MSIIHHWSHAPLPPLRALLPPSLSTATCEQRESAVRTYVWQNCWFTGNNVPPLTGPAQVSGLGILAWRTANFALNDNKGPEMDCGTIANYYVALCSSLGVLARSVCASNQRGIHDISAEFWSKAKGGWIHVLPAFNSAFVLPGATFCASYLEWSTAERNGVARASRVSDTGGLPTNPDPKLSEYVGWYGFYRSAVCYNGNHVQTEPALGKIETIQVWLDPTPDATSWVGSVQPESPSDICPTFAECAGL